MILTLLLILNHFLKQTVEFTHIITFVPYKEKHNQQSQHISSI